jgi:TetR/AcrR family fatty acid metabolism transcriptional regulator
MPRISPTALRALTEERRKQILDAAAKVFGRKGYDRATIADIAGEARVAEGSIYNYFKNKEDLLISLPRSIAEPAIRTIGMHMDRLEIDESVSPEIVLSAMAREIFTIFRRNAHIFRLLITVLPRLKPAAKQKYMSYVVIQMSNALETYFRTLVERGMFREDLDTRIAVRNFIGMIIPTIVLREVLQVEDDREWSYDDFIATAVPLFLHGVMAEPAKRAAVKRETQES